MDGRVRYIAMKMPRRMVPTGDSNTLDASSRVTRPCIEIAAHTPLYEETLSQAYHNPATSKHESTSINVCVHHHLWDKGKTEAVRGHWGSRTRERASVTSIYGSGRRVPLCQGAVEMPACQHDRSAAASSADCSAKVMVGVLRADVARARQGGRMALAKGQARARLGQLMSPHA